MYADHTGNPEPVNAFWDVQRSRNDPLVLDIHAHRQVPTDTGLHSRCASPLVGGLANRGLSTVEATLGSLKQDHHRATLMHEGSGVNIGRSMRAPAKASQSPQSASHSPTTQVAAANVAEISTRRRDAIKAAFRRIDPSSRGWATAHDVSAALQRFSSLAAPEQSQITHALGEGQSRITFATFAVLYQNLSKTIERDVDFEDLLRQHWGFTEVADILSDMKNKFAMVGLAYVFRQSLETTGNTELTPLAFQEAIRGVGIDYGSEEVQRLFDGFECGGSLQILHFIQHLTSAPQPPTPMTSLNGAAPFCQDSVANLQFCSHNLSRSLSDFSGNHYQRHHYHSYHARFDHHHSAKPHQVRLSEPLTSPPDHDEVQVLRKHGHRLEEPEAAPDETEDDEPPLSPPERESDGTLACDTVEAPEDDDEEPEAPPERHGQHEHPQGRYEDEPPLAPDEKHHASYSSTCASPDMRVSARKPSPQRRYPESPSGPSPAQSGGRRRAVTIGINYIGLPVALAGCINDSDTFISLLTEDFGHDVSDIRQLRDDHPQRMPTRKNMIAAMKWLVHGARDGDNLFFHYSGHGSQQADADGDEEDGKDETLVPCDYAKGGMLSDDFLRQTLVTGLPQGVRLTVILDCCHSGTALDLPYNMVVREGDVVDVKKKPDHKLPRPCPADIVLISGCKDCQTSADAGIGLAGNKKAAGAMTTAFKVVISKRPTGSYHHVIQEMRAFLKREGFEQVPQLSSEHFLNLDNCFMSEARASKLANSVPTSLRPAQRKALTIGINYLQLPPGRGRLSGCINDSETMVGIMKEVFGFHDSQICRLRDDRANVLPTKQNILSSLRWLTDGAGPGDELFLHYSGHGGQQEDVSGDEKGGKDDTLIPCDFRTAGQIIDDDLYAHIVEPLPRGVTAWVILDCCHSGTALDLPYRVQVSDGGNDVKLTKSKQRKRGKADVIMLSGCKDVQTSADVQAGAMGASKAAGAMTTAFRHCISPDISCLELITRIQSYLKRNGYEQVPQLSSEQFIDLESSFVHYSSDGSKKVSAVGAGCAASSHCDGRFSPQPSSPLPHTTAVHAFTPTDHYGSLASSPVMPHASPMSPLPSHHAFAGNAAMYSSHVGGFSPGFEHGGMDKRISHLESHIAEMRRTSNPPMHGHSTPGSPMLGVQGHHVHHYGSAQPGYNYNHGTY